MSLLQLSVQSFASAGDTVSVLPLSLAADTAVIYEWFVDDEEIARATGLDFIVPEGLHSSAIMVRASYTDADGLAVSVFSASIKVNASPSGVPMIEGTFIEDGLVSITKPSVIADLDGLGEDPLAYQWFADDVRIADANDEFLVLTQAQVGKRISVSASYTDGDGKSEMAISQQSVSVVNLNDSASGSLSLLGSFTEGQKISAQWLDLYDEDGLPSAFTYSWKADELTITGADTAELLLTQAMVGKKINLTVQFNDQQSHSEQFTASSDGTVVNVNDPTLGSVSIQGAVAQGARLEADIQNLTDRDGIGTFSFQWLLDGKPIEGATQSTLVLADQQLVEKSISVRVVHTDALGFIEPAVESLSQVVANINDTPTGEIQILGDLVEGVTLKATHALSDVDGLPIAFEYQWLADNELILNATTSNWVLQQAQVGCRISVQVKYVDLLGTTEKVSSLASEPVQNVNDLPTGSVGVSGKLFFGETLQASTQGLIDEDNSASFSPVYHFQWRADGNDITGEVSDSFSLTQAQVGQKISVVVSYVDQWGATESATSLETPAVASENYKPTGKVILTGVAEEDALLKATHRLEDLNGLGAITWKWLADGTMVSYGSDRLELIQDYVGKSITAVASYTDALGQEESVASEPTVAVANLEDLCVGYLDILGPAYQGETLVADVFLSDEDGVARIGYQWLVDDEPLAGATHKELTLKQTEVGRQIGLKLTAVDTFGNETLFQVRRSGVVENTNDAPVTVDKVFSGVTNKKIAGSLGGTDVDGDPLSFLLALSPSHGRVDFDEKTGLFEYTPDANFFGLDQFTYQATDGEDVSSASLVQLHVTTSSNRALAGQVYFWANDSAGSGHQLLQNVAVKATSSELSWDSSLTSRSGIYQLPNLETPKVTLSASKSTLADSSVKAAIGLNDVLSALKLYLGKSIPDSSPYSKISADMDGNGKIELSDVLHILKTYLGKTAAITPQWVFVDASSDLSGLTAKACAVPVVNLNLTDVNQTVNLVGVLRGDVNGSWSKSSDYALYMD